MTPLYKVLCSWLTGKVNDAAFKSFARGEVLFMGAAGTKEGFDDWEIEYRFAASANAINLQQGIITIAAKEGWEYAWTLFQEEKDDTAKALVKTPVAAYVEQVYRYSDMSALGIGV